MVRLQIDGFFFQKWQCHHKDKVSADEVLNQRQLLSRVALRTIRFTLSDIQCGADKNWQTKTTWWFTLDQFMFLKVILRIISTTLRLCFVQQKQLDDLSEYSPHEHVLYSIHCDTQSSIKSCFYRVSQWVLSDALAMSLNQGAVTHLYEPHEPTKNRKIKKSWPINAMIASWGFSSYACSCDEWCQPFWQFDGTKRWIYYAYLKCADHSKIYRLAN